MQYHKVVIGSGVVKKFSAANDEPLFLFAGPCVIESRNHALEMSSALRDMCVRLGINLVYKSSFDKSNRSSLFSNRGLGLKKSLPILSEIRERYNVPVVTDVHHPEECGPVAEVVDIIQIPAFLCRQTDLLVSAARTKKPIHIKKGQFLAPWDMDNVIQKVKEVDNSNILLCERGFSFGYNNLISDMRSLPILRSTGYPVIFDATHSSQYSSEGPDNIREDYGSKFVEVLSKASVAVGISGIFIETQQNPDGTCCNKSSGMSLARLEILLKSLIEFDGIAKKYLDSTNF